MMPLITIILLAISLLFAGGQEFAVQDDGGAIMNRTPEIMNKDIPPVDLKVPAVIETATFALG